MMSEFKAWLLKANVLALALAFIIGVALAAVVNSLVKDIIMPPVGLLLGAVDFNNLFIDLSGKHPASLKAAQDAGLATINYGVFIKTVITLIIVAFVVFLIARSSRRTEKPSRFGIMRSSTMTDGDRSSTSRMASSPSWASFASRPSSLSAVSITSPSAGSSSTTSTSGRFRGATTRSGPPSRDDRRP